MPILFAVVSLVFCFQACSPANSAAEQPNKSGATAPQHAHIETLSKIDARFAHRFMPGQVVSAASDDVRISYAVSSRDRSLLVFKNNQVASGWTAIGLQRSGGPLEHRFYMLERPAGSTEFFRPLKSEEINPLCNQTSLFVGGLTWGTAFAALSEGGEDLGALVVAPLLCRKWLGTLLGSNCETIAAVFIKGILHFSGQEISRNQINAAACKGQPELKLCTTSQLNGGNSNHFVAYFLSSDGPMVAEQNFRLVVASREHNSEKWQLWLVEDGAIPSEGNRWRSSKAEITLDFLNSSPSISHQWDEFSITNAELVCNE